MTWFLTGTSRGSMCLHGVPETSEKRQVLSLEMHLFLDTPLNIKKTHIPLLISTCLCLQLTYFKVQAFQWSDVQFMYPKGENTFVQALAMVNSLLALLCTTSYFLSNFLNNEAYI